MSKNYLTDKALKKNYAIKGAWLIVALAIIFVIVVIRFAMAGYGFGFTDDMPGTHDAYSVAQEFIKPTIKLTEVSFPESGYQCATTPDSTYIIKSYAEAKGQDKEKGIIAFEIILKYNGGKVRDTSSWTVVDVREN